MTVNKWIVGAMDNCGVYRLTNISNGHFYIGSSADLIFRRNDHYKRLRQGKHRNDHLQKAFNLYGENSFIFDILEFCGKDKLIEREQFWIDNYKARGEVLYNIRLIAQSCLGVKRSEETKWKISEAKKGKSPSWAKGKKFSEEHRQKISEAKKNISDETRKKMSESAKNISAETRKKMSFAHIGKKISEETKRKMSIAGLGNKNSLGHRHSSESKKKMSTHAIKHKTVRHIGWMNDNK